MIGVSVDAHKTAVVFHGDEAAPVGAKGPCLIVIFGGLDEKGRIVDDRAQILHDIVVHLDAHPHFDAALAQAQIELPGHAAHPVRAGAAGRQNDAARGVVFAAGGDTRHPAVLDQDITHLLRGVHHDALVADIVGHAADIAGQPVAAQVFLFDDEQVDAVTPGGFADGLSGRHVRRVDRPVHAEAVENRFGFDDQGLRALQRHELGQVGLAQLVDVVELAVGEEPGAAHAAQNIARFAALALRLRIHRASAPLRRFTFFQYQDPQIRMLAQVVGGKEAGRPASDDNHVKVGACRRIKCTIHDPYSFPEGRF